MSTIPLQLDPTVAGEKQHSNDMAGSGKYGQEMGILFEPNPPVVSRTLFHLGFPHTPPARLGKQRERPILDEVSHAGAFHLPPPLRRWQQYVSPSYCSGAPSFPLASLDKGMVKSLGTGEGKRSTVFSIKLSGIGVLHYAACQGHLEVCKYLVEELGGDINMARDEGVTPFMISAQSGDLSTMKYFLDHSGDLMKTDDKGRTVLHHAVCTGSCKVTELLLSKGVPVDVDTGCGTFPNQAFAEEAKTPLYHAATNGQDKTVKILLDHHANPNTVFRDICTPLLGAIVCRSLKCIKLLIKAGADVNGKGSALSPLCFTTMQGGYTNFVKFLLKAGADPNIPDDLGRLPVELAALNDCMEEVELLFPLTTPIPDVSNWSIEGVISHAKSENKKPLAIDHAPDAVLYSNRSLCKLMMGDGEAVLSDAYKCRMMRPDWAKACYRQAAAHMLLKEYKQARDALLDAQKLDPGNEEVERKL
ncbi:hypothetical protein U9M48_043975, partial [Paspalum notatum var. saurae]